MRFFYLAAVLACSAAVAGPHWVRQFVYVNSDADLTINDLKFSSSERGIAVGFLAQRDKPAAKPKPEALITSDGGAHWTMVPTKDVGLSLFLLDDSIGWMATPKAIWQTVEAGRSWTKLKDLRDIHQLYFLDRNHGFAIGAPKAVYETKDGGKSWKP
ncbi:MAG: hypothetical protein ABI165_07900, partial [Bryobacteraceae bacterium]